MDRKEIEQFLIERRALTDKGKLNSGLTTLVRNKYPQVIKDLKDITGIDTDNFSQLLYHFYKGGNPPLCPICGNPTKFMSFDLGYKKTCCKSCASKLSSLTSKKLNLEKYGVEHPMQRKDVKEKIKETNLKKYGVENVFASEDIKEKIRKTNLEKYGDECASKTKEIRDKIKRTSLERYGVECPLSNQEIINKRNKTNLDKYGNVCSLHGKEIEEKTKKTNLERYGVEVITRSPEFQKKRGKKRSSNFYRNLISNGRIPGLVPLFSLEEYEGTRDNLYKFKCLKCNKEFYDRLGDGNIPQCPDCKPKTCGTSRSEQEIYDFLCSLIDKNKIIRHDRSFLENKQELDFLIPDYKLAIEYDGLYVHSFQNGKDRNYHLNKTLICENKGFRLIHIFSDEWICKPNIVKSILKSSLNIYDRVLYARKCEVREIDKKRAYEFYEENHLQGKCRGGMHLGLFYEEELVSCLSFIKSRFTNKYSWEISRFANKLGHKIPGGFSKMFSYFLNQSTGSIITYSDRRLFTGSVYRNNGFKELTPTKPGYFYFKNDALKKNRLSFQKWKLVEKYGPEVKKFSEKEISLLEGYYCIYDCGNWKFVYPR